MNCVLYVIGIRFYLEIISRYDILGVCVCVFLFVCLCAWHALYKMGIEKRKREILLCLCSINVRIGNTAEFSDDSVK